MATSPEIDSKDVRPQESESKLCINPSFLDFEDGKFFDCRTKESGLLEQIYSRLKQPPADADKAKTELVLIHGATGAGKTVLATSIRSLVEQDGGYFVAGKFEQLQRQEPHAAFVSAFTQFTAILLGRSEDQILAMRKRVLDSVGSEGKVLTDMIPELVKVLGEQPELISDIGQSSEIVNRFKYVFRNFVGAISSRQHPLVLFLDDLHWADEASLDLLSSLLLSSKNGCCLFVASYRDDNTAPIDRLLNMLSLVKESTVQVTDIRLDDLTQGEVNEVVASVLATTPERTTHLANLVFSHTHGNMFFVLEFVRMLVESNLLYYSQGSWVWDVSEIRVEVMSIDNIIKGRISKLPAQCQEMLKIASCLGSRLDEDILSRLMDETVFPYLSAAGKNGLLKYDKGRSRWIFAHDGVQEVVYRLIDPQTKVSFHYKVGRQLWRCLDLEEIDHFIFLVVGQLMIATSLILVWKERVGVAKLCIRAGERAVQLSSFRTAFLYLRQGIDLLGTQGWQKEYKLCLELHNAAAEVAYCCGNFDDVATLVNMTVQNAACYNDTIRIQATHVYALGSSGRPLEAIGSARDILKRLGETLPLRMTPMLLRKQFLYIQRRLKKRSFESLLRLPLMENTEKLAVMQIFNLVFLDAFLAQPDLAPYLAIRMIDLTLDFGLCAVSCVGFGAYAMLICGIGKDIDEGYRVGQLSFAMYEKFQAKAWLGRISAAFYGCVQSWKRPIKESLEPLRYAHQVGIESGDIEFAMLNANLYLWNQIDLSPLPDLEWEIQSFTERMIFYKQDTALMSIKPLWQLTHNLMGRSHGNVRVLDGEILSRSEIEGLRDLNKSTFEWSQFHMMVLAYLFGDLEAAFASGQLCKQLVDYPFGSVDVTMVMLYWTLTQIGRARQHGRKRLSPNDERMWQSRLKKWASHAPWNFLGKLFLLEAETAALAGDTPTATSKYVCAVALSRESGFLKQTALACELTGKFFLRLGDKKMAETYLREALELYARWGSPPKVQHLRDEIKHHIVLS